jgi:hypothetical protein
LGKLAIDAALGLQIPQCLSAGLDQILGGKAVLFYSEGIGQYLGMGEVMFGVIIHKDRHEHCVGLTVRNPQIASHSMGYVGNREEHAGHPHAYYTHVAGYHHVGAGFQVFAVLYGYRKIFNASLMA